MTQEKESDKERYAQTFGRWIKPDEIVFDFDDKEQGFAAVNFTGINLANAGYCFSIWYAEGQKAPHLHVKNIQGLDDFYSEKLKRYKELFFLKYTPEKYKPFLDLKLAGKHRIAEEYCKHYRYGTIKEMLSIWNEGKENFAERELLELAKRTCTKARKVEITSGTTNLIVQKFSIISIAQKAGIQVRGNMAICPFHADKNPSLSFNDKKGLFYCFGCCTGGNIVDFLYLLETKLKIPCENVL